MRTRYKVAAGLVTMITAIWMLPTIYFRRRMRRIHPEASASGTPVFVYGWTPAGPFTEITSTQPIDTTVGRMELHAGVEVGQDLLIVNTSTEEEQRCRIVRVGQERGVTRRVEFIRLLAYVCADTLRLAG